MKEAGWFVVGLGLLAAFAALTSEPRVEVARDRVLAKIDSVLGSTAVKRQEIEQAVSVLKEGLHGLQKAKTLAQVKHEQLGRRAETVGHEVSEIEASLGKLKTLLMSQETPRAGGKLQSEQIKNIVGTLIERRKARLEQLGGLRAAQDCLQKVVTALERKETEYQNRLGIESQLAVIDANRMALAAMKNASRSMDANDKGFTESVSQLEDKVNSLYADVQAELRIEDAQWSTRQEMQSADDILKAVGSNKDTITEIEAILGKSGR